MSDTNGISPANCTFKVNISKNFTLPLAEIVSDRFVFFNPAFTLMTGFSQEELRKKSFLDIFPKKGRGHIIEVLNLIHNASLFSYTTTAFLTKKDGTEAFCEIKFDSLERDGNSSILASFKEIDQTKGINLSPLISEKLDSIRRLSASLSHEINNPLNIIVNYLYIIEYTKEEEKRKEYLKTALSEVERISKIINWLLDFSSYTPGEISAVDVNEEILNAIELIKNDSSEYFLSINFNKSDDCVVPFTEGQLQKAILNLLLNARDAVRDNPNPKIDIGLIINENYIQIKVQDNGVGIPSEDLERIFDPFFTTKSYTDTRGIGLPMTHRIIESHGGKIYVKSEVNKGTIVKICLPRRRINGKG